MRELLTCVLRREAVIATTTLVLSEGRFSASRTRTRRDFAGLVLGVRNCADGDGGPSRNNDIEHAVLARARCLRTDVGNGGSSLRFLAPEPLVNRYGGHAVRENVACEH